MKKKHGKDEASGEDDGMDDAVADGLIEVRGGVVIGR